MKTYSPKIYLKRRAFLGCIRVFSALIVAGLSAFQFVDEPEFARQLLARFRAYSQQRPTEKAYLQTDRAVYLAGETIWLKGYLINGTTHEADSVSQVLYVELVDPAARRIRLRTQLRASYGYAPGQLRLPDTLAAGTYLLRAYTNFMRNEPDAYFFTKTIIIPGTDEQASPVEPPGRATAQNRPDIQFLPEGGQLIAGIESRVAFRATDKTGQSLAIKGFVVNAQHDTITGFASTHLGMGYLTIMPAASQVYTALVQLDAGTVLAYPLPAVQDQGMVMQVDNLSGKEQIKVYIRHTKTSTDPTAAMTLLAQTRGQPIHVVTVPLAKKTALIQLPKRDFPEGIAQLTLFDEAHAPVCERLVFVNKDARMTVAVATDKQTYKSRERVDLTITTSAAGKPVAANLSLAAVDDRLVPETDTNRATIVSHLLLSSDLTGTIAQPGYYFNPAHNDRWLMLDLLLMTQGWRRFTWANVLAGTPPPVRYPVERGLSLTGRVVRPNGKDIGGKVNLTFLLMKRDTSQQARQPVFLVGETDEAGNFGAIDLDFTDTTLVRIEGVKGKANRDLTIQLDQLLTPTVTITQVPYNPMAFRRDELAEFIRRTREYLDLERQMQRNGEILLKAVTVKGRKQPEFDSRAIYGTPDATVKFDQTNTAGRQTILDVIQGRIPGVQVTGSGFTARVQIRGAANFSGPIEPLFVLDGMPMDLQGIMGVPVADVDRVDVLKGASAAIYGSRGGGGVISILTKRGGSTYDITKDVTPGTLIARLPGYAPVREFYAPRYDVKKPEHIQPDYRATLYWLPMIQTNAEGKATVSFFTSDTKQHIRLRVEGVTPGGMPGIGQKLVNTNG